MPQPRGYGQEDHHYAGKLWPKDMPEFLRQNDRSAAPMPVNVFEHTNPIFLRTCLVICLHF